MNAAAVLLILSALMQSPAAQKVDSANTPHSGDAQAVAPPQTPTGPAPSVPPPTTQTQTPADSILEARTKELASQLRCPVCQGLSLQDSPSELSRQMRNLVKDLLAQGKTPDEVKAYFVSKYGDWILLQPPASGFNTMVYVLPVAALLGGVVLIIYLTRKWSKHPEAAQPLITEDEPSEVA